MFICILSAILAKPTVAVTQLPKVHASQPPSSLIQQGKWYAQAGSHIIHAPHEDSELSPDINDYYYAYGSHDALTTELQDKRVGGEGRLHVFHLPGGVSSLAEQPKRQASRREAVSAFMQLEHKMVLSNAGADLFPVYDLAQDYQSGLSQAGQALENEVVGSLSEDSLYSQLEKLTQLGDDAFPTRSYINTKATNRTVQYLKKQFKDMGFDMCEQTRSDGQKSVIAYLKGTDKSDGVVVLGAHYDSRPFEGLAPGAVDNGSGAAAVLSIARAFAEKRVKPRRTIVFAAFAAEEPGLLGSEEFASRLKDSTGSSFLESRVESDRTLAKICDGKFPALLQQEDGLQHNSGMRKGQRSGKSHEALIMDEIAWKSSNIDTSKGLVVNLESYDWAKDVLEHLAQSSTAHNSDTLTITHSPNPFGSDHMSFLNAGFQAVLSIHGDDEGYPFYHTKQDDLKQVNKALYTKIVKMNAGALMRLAGTSA